MKPVVRSWFFVVVLLVGAIAAAAEPESALETLEPSTALSEVKASSGVVFVDLYAEW